MSAEDVVNEDYSEVIEVMRGHLSKGTRASAEEMRLTIAVIQDACERIEEDAPTFVENPVMDGGRG